MKVRNNITRILLLGLLGAVAVGALATGLSHCFAGMGELNAITSEKDTLTVGFDEKAAAESWADSVMATLTPRERVAQLFFPRWEASGPVTPASVTRKHVVEEGVGGFLLGRGSSSAYAEIINRVQSEAKVPLMVTLDGEWGPNMRVTDAPRFPKNIALGAIQNPELIERYGREVARECKLLGIQVNFAPDLDVNSNPRNPVIGYRSFGENPRRVAELGAAYCRGMERAGVMSVGKHFPGHGDTSVDSHKALPTVDHDLKTLETVDFVPFIEAKKAGMSGIMVGHLRVPALDKSGVPASLSKKITTDVLQNKLGFEGLIFTDALGMKGADIQNENNAVSAFKAGADILLNPRSLNKDIESMMTAIKSGKITQAEVDRRCKKLLIHKFKLGLSKPAAVKASGLASRLNSPEAKSLLGELSKASVTVLHDKTGLLPLNDIENKNIAVVSIGIPSDNVFSTTSSKYCKVQKVSVNAVHDVPKAIAAAKKADLVLVGVFKNDGTAREAYSGILNANGNVVGVFFLNPFKLTSFKSIESTPAVVMAYDDTKELMDAAAQAVFGGIDVSGLFPANIDGVGKLGQGLSLKKKE